MKEKIVKATPIKRFARYVRLANSGKAGLESSIDAQIQNEAERAAARESASRNSGFDDFRREGGAFGQ